MHATGNAESSSPGIERAATNLAQAQKAHGFDVMIAIDGPGAFTETCQEHEIPVVVHPSLRRPAGRPEQRKPAGRAAQDFVTLIEDYRPDVIHCHTLHTALIAITAGNLAGVPCVFTREGFQAVLQLRQHGLRFTTVCLNEASLSAIRREIPGSPAYYVPHGTRSMPSGPAGRDGSPVNLVLAGSLTAAKGGDISVMAMFALRRRLGDDCPVLNIYGDGPRESYLTEMASVLGLNDNVRFHGFTPNILESCPSTDMLVMSSRDEAGPLVVLEAMSRGMPVVATKVGDVTNMLPDERYGRIVPPDSVLPLADAIESLLRDVTAGQFDPDLPVERHRLLYSFEAWTARMNAVYEQAVPVAP
jgi:glycosyltransferase involved in cell wall biosynthesis